MRITVCGLGKLGAPIAEMLGQHHQVVGYDSNPTKGTVSAKEAYRRAEAILFVVPTPSCSDGSFDNRCLTRAMEDAAWYCPPSGLLIVVSTTMPGSCAMFADRFSRPICYKPEFIRLGTVESDLLHPDFILIGESNKEAGDIVESIYSFIPAPIRRMSLVEAELAKIALNCFVTMKISYANQIGMVAEGYGADPHRILEAVGLDHRVGSACLKPGLPYGGPCFPRDNLMFQYVAEGEGIRAFLTEATSDINEAIKRKLLKQAVSPGLYPIGILGLAYKPGTSITERSLGEWLREMQPYAVEAVCHDPNISSQSLSSVLACPVIVVCCPHPEYENLDIPESAVLIDPMRVVKKRRVCA